MTHSNSCPSHPLTVPDRAAPASAAAAQAASIISISQSEIDLVDLPQEAKDELKAEMARKMIDNADRQVQMGQDVQALSASLQTMSTASVQMSEQGLTMTISNTKDDNLGRTEILIGNSDTAQRGKLTRTQSGGGLPASLPAALLIGGLIAAVTIIMLAIAR